MVDHSAKGLAGEPFAMPVELGKIREFARATFATDPAQLAGDAPVSPPTFLMTATFWQDGAADPWPAVALDVARGLHAEQEFEFFGEPPRAGARLTGRSTIEEIFTKQSRGGGTLTFAVMVTDFHDETGALVARTRLTGVETAPVPEATAPAEPGEGA
jgi:hypothetical protein